MSTQTIAPKFYPVRLFATNLLTKTLNRVERVGNALPHPAILFLILAGLVLLASFAAAQLGLTALHPVKKTAVLPVNLLSVAGLHIILNDFVKNFSSFAPLGTVLVAMLGFSFAEKSGLLASILKVVVLNSPRALLTPAVLLAGILSHTAGDIGYVLLIPLSAMAFHSAGLNPLVGLAASFAGVSGGFAANFLLSTADPLLGGLSQEAARIIDPKYVVSPVANYFFMASSSLLIILIGTVVTNKVIAPRFGTYRNDDLAVGPQALSADEKRGLKLAGLALIGIITFLLAGLIPETGFLRETGTGSVIQSPAVKGIVVIIFFVGALTGLAYGYGANTLRGQDAAIKAMQDAMITMAPYIVLVFFAAQFIALFNASNLGLILAVHGSNALKALELGPVTLMIGFILLTCVLDLVIGSASAKWALMAPIFVPMFMLLGYAPELTQASYRIADSVVNIVSPLMSYFPLILAFANKYDPRAKVGTVMAMMLPYSLSFLIFWSLMLFAWMTLELPLGPGSALWYRP